MKTLRVLLGACAMIALLGFLHVATADVRNDSVKPLTFSVDSGDGFAGVPEISFDGNGGDSEEAQTTCAMTPGGNMPGLLLEQPFTPPPNPERLTNAPDETLAPLSSLNSAPPYSRGGLPYNPNDPNDPGTPPPPPDDPKEPSTPAVPEPATLVLVGLGIGVAAYGAGARRRRNKV